MTGTRPEQPRAAGVVASVVASLTVTMFALAGCSFGDLLVVLEHPRDARPADEATRYRVAPRVVEVRR